MRTTGVGPGVLLSLLLALLLTACSGPETGIELPPTPVLSGQRDFALVTESYVRLHVRPDVESGVGTHARRGDVLRVIGRTADQRWIEVEDAERHGWIRRDYLRLFASREQAINGQELLDP